MDIIYVFIKLLLYPASIYFIYKIYAFIRYFIIYNGIPGPKGTFLLGGVANLSLKPGTTFTITNFRNVFSFLKNVFFR